MTRIQYVINPQMHIEEVGDEIVVAGEEDEFIAVLNVTAAAILKLIGQDGVTYDELENRWLNLPWEDRSEREILTDALARCVDEMVEVRIVIRRKEWGKENEESDDLNT